MRGMLKKRTVLKVIAVLCGGFVVLEIGRHGDKYAASPTPNSQFAQEAHWFLSDKHKIGEAVITAQRDTISKEFTHELFAKMNLSGQVLEQGGTPRRTLIVTTWRSGSTFLADLLNSHPASFYHYEPLLCVKERRARQRETPLTEKTIRFINDLMNCDYSNLDEYITFAKTVKRDQFVLNHRLWQHCDDGKFEPCWDPKFISRFCSLFPFQTTKTVRLALDLVPSLIDSHPGLQVVLLVRDPRATMHSRSSRLFCHPSEDCYSPRTLCQDMQADYWAAKRLATMYRGGRLRVVRYEDLAVSLEEMVPRLLRHAGLTHHPDVTEFIRAHTTQQTDNPFSTYRDTRVTPFLWVQHYKWNDLDAIQTQCRDAMHLWGYPLMSEAELKYLSKTTNASQLAHKFRFTEKLDLQNLL